MHLSHYNQSYFRYLNFYICWSLGSYHLLLYKSVFFICVAQKINLKTKHWFKVAKKINNICDFYIEEKSKKHLIINVLIHRWQLCSVVVWTERICHRSSSYFARSTARMRFHKFTVRVARTERIQNATVRICWWFFNKPHGFMCLFYVWPQCLTWVDALVVPKLCQIFV